MQSIQRPVEQASAPFPSSRSYASGRYASVESAMGVAGRRAFSLIELMVVIVIIIILMSLLLVGVRGAMRAARNASVTVEFKNLEAAIANFNAKFGSDPPSGILLFETPAGWAGSSPSAAAVNRSRALIRQMWPDFNFALARDINGDGDSSDTLALNGAECLVFFLGGVPTPTSDPNAPWRLEGFSSNGENPFVRGGARVASFYEFAPGRLMNRDAAGSVADPENMPEYRDDLPGQTQPILYASSYGGKGYRDVDVQLTAQPTYDAYATVPSRFAYVYRRYSLTTYPATVANFNAAERFNPRTYQLISPGVDGEYGWGGILSANMELLEPRAERIFERDNITNFRGGTLN